MLVVDRTAGERRCRFMGRTERCVCGGGRLHIPREDRTVCVCVVVGGAHTKKEPNRWWRTGHVPGEDRTVWGKLGSAKQSGVAGFQNCQTKE